MRLICILALIAFFSAPVMALTLEEAVSMAIKSDDSIKQQRALTEAAEHSKKSSFSAFLPTADLSYQYSHTELGGVSGLPISRESRNSSFAVRFAYNLFNGMIDHNTYLRSDNRLLMQKYNYTGNAQDVILSTKTAYIAYLKARNQLQVANETLKLLEAQKRTAEVSYQVGTFSKADVLKVDVQLASTQLELLNAQINMKLAGQELERFIGRPIAENENVAELDTRTDYPIPSLSILYDMLEDNRSEMLYTKAAYKDATLARKVAKGSYLPKVDLGLTFGWNGYEEWPFDGRNDNYDDSRAINFTATWNVFDGFRTTHNYLAAAKQVDASTYAVSDLRKKLRLQVSNAYEYYTSAVQKLNVATVGLDSARENYRVTQSMYDNSEATTTDLLDANVALSGALNAYASASYDIISAVAQVERAVETELLGLNVVIPDYDEEKRQTEK